MHEEAGICGLQSTKKGDWNNLKQLFFYFTFWSVSNQKKFSTWQNLSP